MGEPATSDSKASIWPSATAVRDNTLLLAGLILIAALADGELVKWLSGALIVVSALWGIRGSSQTHSDVPLSWILASIFIAITIATVFAEGEWFYVVIFALALPLVVLTRLALVLRSRRESRHPGAT